MILEETIFIKQATSEKPIQAIEQCLHELNGIERVLIDTDDGEVKIEYDEQSNFKGKNYDYFKST